MTFLITKACSINLNLMIEIYGQDIRRVDNYFSEKKTEINKKSSDYNF
jgi:hypothetical protein